MTFYTKLLISAPPGAFIEHAVKAAVRLASLVDQPVVLEFNERFLNISSGKSIRSVEDILNDFK